MVVGIKEFHTKSCYRPTCLTLSISHV